MKAAGNSAFHAGEYLRAAECFSKALCSREPEPEALSRDSWDKAHLRRGDALYDLGRFSEAVEAFQRAAGAAVKPEKALLKRIEQAEQAAHEVRNGLLSEYRIGPDAAEVVRSFAHLDAPGMLQELCRVGCELMSSKHDDHSNQGAIDIFKVSVAGDASLVPFATCMFKSLDLGSVMRCFKLLLVAMRLQLRVSSTPTLLPVLTL
eukprot:gene2307-3032_t